MNVNMSNQASNWRKAKLLAISTVLCCINMIFYEKTLRLKPGSAHFLTLVQHMFISMIGIATLGLPFGLGSTQPKIPVRAYLPLVVLNYISIFAHNISLILGISIPLNMVFKSSSLIANLLLGMVFLSHRYSPLKYLSVLQITAGLVMCTLEDYRVKHAISWADFVANLTTSDPGEESRAMWRTTLGIVALTVSLLFSAGMGVYQEYLRKHYGKHPAESLFYVHFLALPLIVMASSGDLWLYGYETITECFSGKFDYALYLGLTVGAQWLCASSVFKLTTECSSLTVTLCLTNRKFFSLVFSILFFGNLFTSIHWIGAFVVFSGTSLFAVADIHWLAGPPKREPPLVGPYKRFKRQ